MCLCLCICIYYFVYSNDKKEEQYFIWKFATDFYTRFGLCVWVVVHRCVRVPNVGGIVCKLHVTLLSINNALTISILSVSLCFVQVICCKFTNIKHFINVYNYLVSRVYYFKTSFIETRVKYEIGVGSITRFAPSLLRMQIQQRQWINQNACNE